MENVINKWNNTGFLTGLSGETNIKVAEAFELAEGIINGNMWGNPYHVNISTYPIIRIALSYTDDCTQKLPESFKFDSENMHQLIQLVDATFTVFDEVISKRVLTTSLDLEAELTHFISRVFVLNVIKSLN